MRCLWYGVLENLKRIPKVPGSRPFGEKSAVRIDDNGLRIFYKKDTLILLFTIVIIILNMFNIGNTQNLTWAAIISFIKGKKNDIFELLRRKRTVTSFEARGLLKTLLRNEKVELNSFIDEFVKARQKYFTPGQEWLEAELAEEKISVYMDKAQLEKDLDELVKTSLMYGKVRNLEMKIQVKKTADGAGICFSDNGVGNWRNKSICVTGKPGRGLETKKIWGVQVA